LGGLADSFEQALNKTFELHRLNKKRMVHLESK